MARRGWDQGYSFRSGDFRETPAYVPDDRQCARGDRCSDTILVPEDGGSYRREARPCHRTFCDRDWGVITMRLLALPEGCTRLAAESGELRRAGSSLRMPFGPSLPLHEGMEALCREMARTLAAWHARVAAVPGLQLTRLDPRAVLDDAPGAVRDAAGTLEAHMVTLLGLQPGWMKRAVPASARQAPEALRDPLARPRWRVPARDWLPAPGMIAAPRGARILPPDLEDEYGDFEIVTTGPGYILVLDPRPDGATAGLDILSLHNRCERLLGEVREQADTLDGVPCRECDDIALERAEPPSDPSRPAMYSVCATCRHMMSLEDYRAWSAWYARWADGAGLECYRCQRGYHDLCVYDQRVSAHGGCQCMACGHVAA